VHSNNDQADFRGSLVQPNGAGHTRAWATGVDTKLGGQLSAALGNGLTATVQVLAEQRADNTFRPQFEWANLKYQINDNYFVRAGRVVAPVFMISDYRNVGYAQTTVRPAYDVYQLNPVKNMDGGEFGAKWSVGSGTLSMGMLGGRFKAQAPSDTGDTSYVTGSMRNINFTYEIDASTFRLSYNRSKNDARSNAIAMIDSAYRMGFLVGYPVPNGDLHNGKTRLLDLGYAYDDGKWLAQAEFVSSRSNDIVVQDTNAWFGLVGYRVGKWTPYVGYARATNKEPPPAHPAAAPVCNPPTNPTGCPGSPMLGQMQQLAGAINQIDRGLNTHVEQRTVTLGTRYDIYKNMALKAQFDQITKPALLPDLNKGAFSNTTPLFLTSRQKVNLVSLTLDFVF